LRGMTAEAVGSDASDDDGELQFAHSSSPSRRALLCFPVKMDAGRHDR
jgi:hypothetical protein